MFTGLVEELGVVLRRERRRGVVRMHFETKLGPLTLGESISVHGVCLTVDSITKSGFEADLSSETLSRTTLANFVVGSKAHLERATQLGGRMGGHVVLGHVDGIGHVTSTTRHGDTLRMEVWAPPELARYLAPKGSICIDGVSLTVNGVVDEPRGKGRGRSRGRPGGGVRFDVMLVPHTLARTALGELSKDDPVNLEVDVLARYVQRQLELGRGEDAAAPPASAPAGGEEGRNADAVLYAKLRAGGFA